MEFITNTNNLILLALMMVSGALLIGPNLQALIQGQAGVSPAIATQLINRNKANILDLRTAEAFASGHIARARHISADKLLSDLPGIRLDKKVPIILVCESGAKSSAFVGKIKALGFEDVVCLDGGIKAWNQAQLPLV
jgi:rhodanese-related sulfurtransferase